MADPEVVSAHFGSYALMSSAVQPVVSSSPLGFAREVKPLCHGMEAVRQCLTQLFIAKLGATLLDIGSGLNVPVMG